MRVAPVALAAASEQAAALLARRQSEVTHPNDSCLDACSGFARLLSRTVETGELRFDTVQDYFAVAEVRQAADASLQDGPPAMSGWVLHTLCGALWAVRGADCFGDAVGRAVALGIDADTVGAVAGALAGARWGMGGIPPELSARLQSLHPLFQGHYPQVFIDLADGLVAGKSDATTIDR